MIISKDVAIALKTSKLLPKIKKTPSLAYLSGEKEQLVKIDEINNKEALATCYPAFTAEETKELIEEFYNLNIFVSPLLEDSYLYKGAVVDSNDIILKNTRVTNYVDCYNTVLLMALSDISKSFIEVSGDLIKMAENGHFDVIVHGCNCFNTQNSGIALLIKNKFETHKYSLETENKGDYNKLGQIESKNFIGVGKRNSKVLTVVNAYTQYHYGKEQVQLDYTALKLVMRKINNKFKGKHIGLPLIGCGLAGGDWETVRDIIKTELNMCKCTIVHYEK